MAFDPIKKKTMEEKTTQELLEIIQAGFLSQPQGEALEELFLREIKEDDADDLHVNNLNTTRGGVRPRRTPIV